MMDKTRKEDNRKVAIIGAGAVGSSIAYALTIRNLANEIVLIDVDRKRAHGEALDIQHGISTMGKSSVRAGDYEDCADCDLIIITAGRARRVGESRLDMISDNVDILKKVTESIKEYYTDGVLLVVSNPVDILTHKVAEWMDLPNGRVFGTGCILDTSRLIRSISDYTGISTEAIKCNIVGEHGDTQFPVWSRLSIEGLSMEEYCENVGLEWGEKQRKELNNKIRSMGAEIIESKGRTHYGIATCACMLADAILNKKPTIAPVTSPLQGEYGLEGISISVPSIVGANGVERRLEEHWTEKELANLIRSSEQMKITLSKI